MPAPKKTAGRRLGRGLGSLIGTPVKLENPASPDPESSGPSLTATPLSNPSAKNIEVPAVGGSGIRMLGLDSIRPNPNQPRQRFSEEAIRSLADSIQTAGLMQPIVVRPSANGFEIVAGERRWRAFGLLGKTEIPSIVRTVDDQTAAEWALIENLQREDLDALERADGIARLMEEFGLSQSAVATQIGLDRTTVTNLLRLRDADPNLRAALVEGLVTQGHAKALLGMADLVQRSKLLERCVREGWSVRETERRVREVPSLEKGDTRRDDQTPGGGKTAHIADLEKRLAQHLGTKVSISLGRKKGRGRLSLEFFSIEQFDGLLEKIGFDANSE